MENPLKVAQLFYRTSVTSRSHPSFQRDEGLLPPFVLPILNDVLHKEGFRDGIQIFHVAEGEADGYCVSLAEELGAFVLGNDSDFAILGASIGETGYRGYVPIEMVQWVLTEEEPASTSAASTVAGSEFDDDDGFTVKRAKKRPNRRGMISINSTTQTQIVNGLAPPALNISPFPDAVRTLRFVMPTYSPATLSERLRIPPTHLRLLASLLGTDHSPPEAPALFFDHNMKKSARIEHTANVIRECLVPGASARLKRKRLPHYATPAIFRPRAKDEGIAAFSEAESGSAIANAGDELYSFISLVVQSLLLRPLAKDEMLHDLVISLIEATCHYILPGSPTELGLDLDSIGSPITGYCCSTYPYCVCHPVEEVGPSIKGSTEPNENQLERARQLYARANKSGHMNTLSAYLHSDRSYLQSCLADPEGQPLRALEEASGIRITAWEIMLDALRHLPCETKASPVQDETGVQATVDVDEEEEVAQLAGDAGDAGQDELEADLPEVEDGNFYIVDYLRLGSSTRLTEFYLPLFTEPALYNLIAIKPVQERFEHFASHFGLVEGKSSRLPGKWQVLVAVIRLSVDMHTSLAAKRKAKLLTQKEVRRGIIAGVLSERLWSGPRGRASSDAARLMLETRNCHIVALVTTAGQEVLQLAQALRLHGAEVHNKADEFPNGETTTEFTIAPYRFVEGTVWHQTLTSPEEIPLDKEATSVVEMCMQAVAEGRESKILGWRGPATSKDTSTSGSSSKQKTGSKPIKGNQPMSRYDMLAGVPL